MQMLPILVQYGGAKVKTFMRKYVTLRTIWKNNDSQYTSEHS